MTRRPTEPLTPFEETLAAMPHEDAPADLQDRCLAALDAAQAARPKRAPMARWRQLAVAACASIMIAVALSPVFLSMGRDHAQPVMGFNVRDKMAAGPAAPASAPQPVLALEAGDYAAGREDKLSDKPIDATGGLRMPGGPAAAPAGVPPVAQRQSRTGTSANNWEGDRLAIRSDEVQGKRGRDVEVKQEPAAPSIVPAPAEPWYNRSDDRQKISRRQMEVETPDVEAAYRNAIGIIEKAKGYVAEEELLLQEDDPDTAHISARVPSEDFDGVLTQLRGIGKLVKMSGRSEDRTQEYKTRGADVRALSLTEQSLVARYEREANPTRKAILKQELATLRQQLKRDKQMLLALAAETSFAYLDLGIEESGGLWHKLTKTSQRSVPLAMAGGALIMLPFLIVALLWKRR